MKSSRFRKLSIFTLITSIPLGAFAQSSILVDWNHNWNYHHPSNGVLAAGSGTTAPHPDGTTPWFADAFSFAANYSGPSFTTGGADFDAGSGPGPLGYGTINYFTDPNPAPAEFTAFGTTIPDPGSGTRLTSYFRTTFNVPNDGNFYLNPSIQYLLDDGAFVYLDGELILEVNVDTADEYSANAITSAQTENILSSADLSLPAGSATGINAITIKSIDRLTPGTHTIAVSLHNHTDVSTDLAMAFQLVTEVTDCIITGSAGPSSRDFMGTPANPAGDTINAEITVAAEGVVSPNWTIVGPAGSSLLGLTGAYDTPLILANIPVAEFANGTITIEIADSANSSCTTNIDLAPLRIIGTNSLTATPSPIITSGSIDSPGWVFDENTRSLEMSDPGGTVPFDVASEDIDLTGQPDVQFTGTLTVEDLSTGTEALDSFSAFLIYDGDTANPVSLIGRHDFITPDGLLNGAELASSGGTFILTLDQIIPASVDSVRLVLAGVTNSLNEILTVSNLGIQSAPPELQAYALPAILDNQGTDSPLDDTYSTDLVITPANLPFSSGWTSDQTPASGLYSSANPVNFGPFPQATASSTINLTDSSSPNLGAQVTVTRDAPLFTVFEVSNVSRIENGPGIADDTFSFDLDIANPNGGPRWVTSSTLVSPTNGTYGLNTLTVHAPLTPGSITLDITDVSYPTNTQQIELEIPLRYQIAQSDLSGTLVDVSTNLDEDQSTRWVNDLTLNTVTFDSNGSNADSVISSEVLDLSDSGEVFFSGILTANETSTSSNFETIDRFKAELIYNLDGEPTTINLISPFDTGDGTSALTGVNGPPDGFLNGYNGNIGTDALNGTVYASGAENYNANLERDEFNLNGLPVDGQITAAFNLFATIPADADDATLVITAQRISGSEEITLSDLLFSSTPSNPDLDNDGIPNSYEIANGLNPNDPADAFTDLDGDGRSNLSEFIAATDPNDPSLFLGITSYSLNGNLVQLSWSSIPGITYGIQTSSDLNNWTDLGRVIPANASPATVTSTADINLNGLGTPAKTFFRVFVIE